MTSVFRYFAKLLATEAGLSAAGHVGNALGIRLARRILPEYQVPDEEEPDDSDEPEPGPDSQRRGV